MRQSHDAYISRSITDSEDGTPSINSKSFIKKLRKNSNGTQFNGNIITDCKEKANAFNSHFRSVLISQMKSYLIKVLAHTHSWKISL